MRRFLKTFGKLVTYAGHLVGIHGIVHSYAPTLIIGIAMIVLGCLSHELNEN